MSIKGPLEHAFNRSERATNVCSRDREVSSRAEVVDDTEGAGCRSFSNACRVRCFAWTHPSQPVDFTLRG